MKRSTKLIFTLLASVTLLTSYNIGLYVGREDSKEEIYETLNKVADRYFLHVGDPTTLEDHCRFVQTVYGDYNECDFLTGPIQY